MFEIQIPAGTPVIGAVTFFQIKLGKFRLLRVWRIFLLVLGVLSLLVGALCLLVSLDVLALAPVVMGILLLLLGAGLPRMAVRMADNMLKKDLKSCHPVCITFDGDGVRKTVHGIVTTVPYESFSHLLLCRGSYVVGLEGETTRYQSLPKDCFTQGDPEAFPDFFREKTGLTLYPSNFTNQDPRSKSIGGSTHEKRTAKGV